MRPATSRRPGGFTMVEVIAVMTIITIFAGLVGYAFMRGGGSSLGLQSAQTTLIGLLQQARGHAAMSGLNTGVFLQVATSDGIARETAQRYLVVAEQSVPNNPNSWRAIVSPVALPIGCYVLRDDNPTGWPFYLRSTALEDDLVKIAGTENVLDWCGIAFTARGTAIEIDGGFAPNGGKIVLCTGHPLPPGGSDPFEPLQPENVRGVRIYAAGLVRSINDRNGFEN